MKQPCTRGLRSVIRVRKEDAAFLYFVLEAQEGITSYRTLEHPGDAHFRDLELLTPNDFIFETMECLKVFKGTFTILSTEIPEFSELN